MHTYSWVFLVILSAVLASVAVLWIVLKGGPPETSIGPALISVLAAVGCSWVAARSIIKEADARARALARAGERATVAEAENAQLASVLGGMSEGVLVTDEAGRETFANPNWRQLFGPGAGIDQALAPDLSPRAVLDRILATTVETRESQQAELEIAEGGSGSRRTLILTSSPLAEGEGVVVVAQDVTEFLRVTEIRRDFVANVSHELKTPLSAIRGFAETLADGAVEDPRASREFLSRILKQCERLEALLTDLLTLSRLEHTAGEGRRTTIELAGIVHEAIEVVSERVEAKNLDLAVDAQPIPRIKGDATALERLCVNLLDNAVKYNREGGEIRVGLRSTGSEVVLEVRDTGIGIPKASVERLFERFYRVDKGRSRQEGGTGLGLAIVKHAAHLHGGSVEVESELGKGSLFRVRLPLD